VAEPGSRTKLSKRKLEKYLKNQDFKQVMEHGLKIAERIGLSPEADTFNPVIVDFYREVGYLPWAIDNYLTLLGWSFDDKTEYFTREELIRCFSLERINSSPASFDPKKLWAMQDTMMVALPVEEKLQLMMPFLMKAGLLTDPPSPEAVATVRQVIEAAGDRLKVAGDILVYADFFLMDEPPMDEAAVAKRLAKPGTAALLKAYAATIESLEAFEPEPLEAALKQVVSDAGVKAGDLVHAVRVAVSGKTVGPGLYESLAILGREKSLARLTRALPLCGEG
jgi:glutamyl-tRNA synthetase